MASPPPRLIRRVAITGGTHGNESNGVHLAKHILRNPTFASRPSFEVEVFLTNTAAIEKNVRYVDEDLNRCFESSLLADASRSSIEAKRARELNALLGPKGGSTPAFDLIIDLHNTTAATGVALLTAPADDICVALSASLIDFDPTVRLCYWKDKPRAEYPLLPSIAPHGLTFEVGPASWGCIEPALYAQSLKLLGKALDYVHAHNQAVAGAGAWVQATVPVYKGIGVRKYPRYLDGDLAAMVHPDLQGNDFCALHVGDPIFQTHDLKTIGLGGEGDTGVVADEDKKTTFYPFFINEAAYYEVDVAFNLAVREEQAVKVAVSADEHSASKRQKSA